MATRAIRVDSDVRAALDRVRDQYGDRNYSSAIRRVLRWKQISEAESDMPDDVYGLWKQSVGSAHAEP